MLQKAFSVSMEFLPKLVSKYELRCKIQCLAFELDVFDLLTCVRENHYKKLVTDINVSLCVISTCMLSCIVFRENEGSSNFK